MNYLDDYSLIFLLRLWKYIRIYRIHNKIEIRIHYVVCVLLQNAIA